MSNEELFNYNLDPDSYLGQSHFDEVIGNLKHDPEAVAIMNQLSEAGITVNIISVDDPDQSGIRSGRDENDPTQWNITVDKDYGQTYSNEYLGEDGQYHPITDERFILHELIHMKQIEIDRLPYPNESMTPEYLETLENDAVKHTNDIMEKHGEERRVEDYTNPDSSREVGGQDTKHNEEEFLENQTGIQFEVPPGEEIPEGPPSGWTRTAELLDEIVGAIDSHIQFVLAKFGIAENTGSPLVLDLDGDGIELVTLADTTVYWDIDEDGFAEASGWAAADDGFLAIDLDGNGSIDHHSELFGSLTEDGFSALSAYDTNLDGVIDIGDTQFEELLVWRDVNQNGISESGELYSLLDLNIVSVNADATAVTQTNAGHNVSHISTYTIDDGVTGPQTLDIVDVWFQYDNTNTSYTGNYTVDVGVLFLPTLRGYGNLLDLYVSTSIDNDRNDPNSLMSLLNLFSTKGFAELFVDSEAVIDDIRDILFRWAGVDNVDPLSRGDFVDARELEFLEKLIGRTYNSGYDPGGAQGEVLSEAFDIALQGYTARLIAQAAGQELFEGDFHFNPISGMFEGILGLNQIALDTLLAKAQDASQVSDKVAYWGDVVRVIDQIVGVANLSTGDASALETAITTSDSTLTTQKILDTLEWNSDIGQIISGTSSADTLDGTIGDDTIYGGYGNDTVTGGIGDDTLRGQGHDDILNGQSGDDALFGESGNDTYLYFAGQGSDTITEQSSGIDKLVFGPGVTFSDLTLTRISNTDVQIDLSNAVGGGTVTILNQFGNANSALVELLEFNDSSTVDLSTIIYTLTGTAGADTLKGIRYGGSQDDTIYGLDGDDTITGYFSTLDYGNNWLYGGTGNDTIYGAHGVDYIEGGADNDHIRGYNGDDELHGGDGDDELWGQNQNDTLYGEGGADILKGDNHNDVLIGGLGADELWGGSGYDTFTFLNGESFDAVDTIKDFNTTYDAIDISDLLSAYDPLTDAITDFVQITDNGMDSTLAIDVDGGADAFVAIALIAGKTGLTDEAALETSGTLIAA